MKKSLKLIFSTFVLGIAPGCLIKGGYHNNNVQDVELGSNLSQVSELTGSDRSVAFDICYAFKSKNISFRAESPMQKDFKVNYTDCSGKKTENESLNTTLKSILDINPMVYDSISSMPYMKYAETNQHGHLSNICNNLINGNDVTNTEDVGGGIVKQFHFGSNGGKDFYMVVIAEKLSNTTFKAIEKHTYHVETASDETQLKGGVYKYTFEKSCSGENTESFSQSLVK